MKVAIYIRVSSHEQKDVGLSLPAQHQKLTNYANEREWIIHEYYVDEGISAHSIHKRHGFKQMLSDAESGSFNVILVTKFDRAFRNVMDAIMILDKMNKINVDFVSMTEMIDTTNPYGRAMFQIISVFAELERNLTADRVKDINQYKYSQGIIIGKRPMGYKFIYKNPKEKKQVINVVIDEKESLVVKEIFNRTLRGDSYKDICKDYKISVSSYYKMIRNRTYLGIIKGKGGEEKDGLHPQIIDEVTFNAVSERINNNRVVR